MTKRNEHLDAAREMYVIKHLTFSEIALHLGVADKTVRNWAKDGAWQERRQELVQQHQSMHELLYESAYLILQTIRNDLKDGKPVDTGRFYAIKQMIAMLEQSRSYERTEGLAEEQKEPERELVVTEELLSKFKSELKI